MEHQITTIHFIDDAPEEFLISKMLFRRDRFDLELKTYGTSEEFLDAVSDENDHFAETNVIVTDLNLIGESGVDVIRAVRKTPALKASVTGVCSGSNDPVDRKNVLEAGGDFFIPKSLGKESIECLCQDVKSLVLRSMSDGGLQLIHDE